MFGAISVREKIILGLLAALLLAGIAWRFWQSPGQPHLTPVDPGTESTRQEAEPELITVHLVGAVNRPGVYQLAAGARVHQLLELAGGPAADADLETVNLARPLSDGEQVQICRFGEALEGGSGSGSGSKKININRATAAELETLPGIGPARAKGIVEHRDKYGYFKDITEIMDVSGIGEGIFNTIEDLITIY